MIELYYKNMRKNKKKIIFIRVLVLSALLLIFIFKLEKIFMKIFKDLNFNSFGKVFWIIFFLVLWLIVVSIYQTHKKMPQNLNYQSIEYGVDDSNLEFLYDLTYLDEKKELTHEQSIFDSIFKYINEAEEYILIDMFLYNSYQAKTTDSFRGLSKELTEVLIKKKEEIPTIKIDVITDPINIVYGGGVSKELNLLRRAGINVIISDVRQLRDSNFIYSSVWRTFIQWFGNSDKTGTIKHPFSSIEEKVSLRSYLGLANFKANHRKVFIVDNKNKMISIVSSANPHDGSAAHSNVAMLFRGEIWKEIFNTETAVAKISNAELNIPDFKKFTSIDENSNASVQIVSESRIKEAVINELNFSRNKDDIKIAQFYMADRDIVKALIAASNKGVAVEIILDSNKDAFGYKKNGIPNRQVAHELRKKSQGKIKIRWYDTHGEQFHSKIFIAKRNKKLTAILGSANLTRRNLDNYNLELDAKIVVNLESKIAKEILEYFSRIWENKNGVYTVDYGVYEDRSFLKTLVYRIQEKVGLSSF